MYIKKLELLNFQVIKEFKADFNGNVYFVTGDNELGKSTLLKAIGALLTGERDDVLRNGETKGFAKMVVGGDGEEYDVQLSFTENNPRGTLTIKTSNGMQSNNVSMLQSIFGYQDFDAVEFSRWSETAEGRRKQIAVVKSLLPVAVRERIEKIDAEVSNLKSERTGVNRDVKTFESLVKAANVTSDDITKYAEPIDVKDLMQKQQTNAALIEKAKTVRTALQQRTAQLGEIPGRIESENTRYENEIASINKTVEDAKIAYEKALKAAEIDKQSALDEHNAELEKIESEKKDIENRKANAEKWMKDYEANNPEKSNIPDMLAQADEHNKKHALVNDYLTRKKQLDDVVAKSESMDKQIEQLNTERAELIAKSELPIAGLSFTDDGLELNGVPFMPGKVSDSQQMMVAAKLIVASNSKVKVFCVSRGESLGAKRLQELITIAKDNGFQGFLENVVRGQEEMRIEEYTEPI